MSYEIDDIKMSHKIFYHLLKNGELREEKEKDLCRAYSENERVQNLVKDMGEASECSVEKYGGTVYLIPWEDNDFLGYSKGELKYELCKSNATDKDYYLSQFAILTLLVEMYGSRGSSAKSRNYLRGGDFLNIISARLREGAEKNGEEDQDRNGIAFTNILERFEALKSGDRTSRSKTTKEGFLYGILRFLDGQGLIDYIEADDMIKTTGKLDSLMDWNVLNRNNYSRVLKALGEAENEQD
jgi:hypothetical protein